MKREVKFEYSIFVYGIKGNANNNSKSMQGI